MTEWTLCWRCNASFLIDLVCCPSCKATNANVDLRKAEREMWDEMKIDLPPEAPL